MHSTIFQITTEKVEEKDALLNENTLQQGDYSDLDYCSDIDEMTAGSVLNVS